MLRRVQISPALPIVVVLSLAVCLAGCTSTPSTSPSTSPTPTESTEVSESPSPPSTPDPIAIPDCTDIYSPAVVASLTSEGRTSSGDVSGPGMGGWGTGDPGVEVILAAITDRVNCTWILPATESGSTTSIARLDGPSRTALVAAFASAGFTASTTPDGELYSIEVETEVGSYNETHLLTSEFWVGSVFSGGDSAVLTLDAAAQLLP